MQGLVEGFGAGQIAPERLFQNHARGRRAVCLLQLLHDRAEHRRRDREVVRRQLSAAEGLFQLRERVGVGVVTVHVPQLLGQDRECVWVEAAVLGAACLGALDELFERGVGLGHADDRKIQHPAARHALQSWKNLFVGEVAGGTEEGQCVRSRFSVAHEFPFLWSLRRTSRVVETSRAQRPAVRRPLRKRFANAFHELQEDLGVCSVSW